MIASHRPYQALAYLGIMATSALGLGSDATFCGLQRDDQLFCGVTISLRSLGICDRFDHPWCDLGLFHLG